MLDLQEPFLKLSVTPSDPASVDVSKFVGAITDGYIQSIISSFGSEYFIVSSSLDGPGHINIVYSFLRKRTNRKFALMFHIARHWNLNQRKKYPWK